MTGIKAVDPPPLIPSVVFLIKMSTDHLTEPTVPAVVIADEDYTSDTDEDHVPVKEYSTVFEGQLEIEPPLSYHMRSYLDLFCRQEHVKRDADKCANHPDPFRVQAGMPVGIDGEFYTGNDCDSIVDESQPPSTQPSLFCNWQPSPDGSALEWNQEPNSEYMDAWLEYLIKNILAPNGYTVNGTVLFSGQFLDDCGTVQVKDNVVNVYYSLPGSFDVHAMWQRWLKF